MREHIKKALITLTLFLVVLAMGLVTTSCVGNRPASKSSNNTYSTSNDGSNGYFGDWKEWRQFGREYNL